MGPPTFGLAAAGAPVRQPIYADAAMKPRKVGDVVWIVDPEAFKLPNDPRFGERADTYIPIGTIGIVSGRRALAGEPLVGFPDFGGVGCRVTSWRTPPA